MLIESIGLTKMYGNTIVLNNVNLEIPKGKIIGLLGPNGSGKTTFIKLINDLIQPTSGFLKINDQNLSIETKNYIAYLPERSYLDNNQKVSDSLKMFQDFFPDFQIEEAKHILNLFEIPINRKLHSLSKGQKGKVHLALVMARKVDLYILDEPLDGMDPASRDFIMKIIKKYRKEGSTIILSTHQIADIESNLDQAILLRKGEVIDYDDCEKLRSKYKMTLGEYFKEVFKYDEKTI
ncbi:ABC transporter ATP-binding protein [Acholeplasma equirhinis]|uniref:ABC transporter ATP-binding protein n=1 Tax=Acholeplasma equirhinis TaxID=555393 RepID=UPI001F08D8CE|nr:ABC transporter ATP-binding protein [Acholeplasma equirhinis]